MVPSNQVDLLQKDLLATLMNEWMRRFIEEPDKYMAEFQAVELFKAQEADGQTPDYGTISVAYLQHIPDENIL